MKITKSKLRQIIREEIYKSHHSMQTLSETQGAEARTLNKFKFLFTNSDKMKANREKRANEFIEKIKSGEHVIDHTQPVIKKVINLYVDSLFKKGAVDEEDAQDLKSATEYVVELDTFKDFAAEHFGKNVVDLAQYEPFKIELERHAEKMYQDHLKQQEETQ